MARKSVYCEAYEDFIAEKWAIGVPVLRISQALGIPNRTVADWIEKKPELRKKAGNLRLQLIESKLKDIFPLAWLERIERESFGPPDQNVNLSGELTVNALLEVRKKINEVAGLDEVAE